MGNNIRVAFRGSGLAESIKTNTALMTQEQIEACFEKEDVKKVLKELASKCKIRDEVIDHGDVSDLVEKLDAAGLHQDMADLANLAFDTDIFKVM